MARRDSIQSRPGGLNPAPSAHAHVFNAKGEASQDTDKPSGPKRSSSVTGFFTKLLPSRRPERSGTLRDKGFWEQQQSELPEPELRPVLGHKHGSDSIVSSCWNPAHELPPRAQATKDPSSKGQPHPRLQSQRIGNAAKSLTPRQQRTGGQVTQQVDVPADINQETVVERAVVTSTVGQQPVRPEAAIENARQGLATQFDAKREARRLRRTLKESSDFLGVQGINPQTGVMDVLTPTSSSPTDRTMMSAPEPEGYSESMTDFRAAYQRAARTRDAEEASLERLRKEQERLAKIQRKKDSVRTFQQRVMWRKERNQWSSVAEPDLSPIADASTRSRTPRSTSDGAIVPPPAIQKILRWQERRAASTPAGLQTTTATTPDRPGIVAQESSDTVIHTPHPGGDRRYSVAADVPDKQPVTISPEAPRRASEPVSGLTIGSPGSSASDRRISRKPVPPPKDKQKPPPLTLTIPGSSRTDASKHFSDPPNKVDPFLGIRKGLLGARRHNIRDQATVSPSTPSDLSQQEKSRLGGIPTMTRTPDASPPDVAVRDFAHPGNRRVWFADDAADPGTAKMTRPTIDQNRDANVDTTTSSRSHQKTLHRYRTPLIALERGSDQKHTSLMPESEVEDQADNLVDIGMPSETTDLPTSGWAQQLMNAIADFGQDAEITPSTTGSNRGGSCPADVLEARRDSAPAEGSVRNPPPSAFIPTTIITGYDPRLLVQTRGLNRRRRSEGTPQSMAGKHDRVIQISATEAATKLQLEEQMRASDHDRQHSDDRATRISTREHVDTKIEVEPQSAVTGPPPQPTITMLSTSALHPTQLSFDLLASPPRLPPNVWPSLDIPAPHQGPRRISDVTEDQELSSGPTTITAMIPYDARPGLVSGTTSSPDNFSVAGRRLAAEQLPLYATAPQKQTVWEQTTAITSAPQLSATRERCERLYWRASRLHPSKATEKRVAPMTPAVGPCIDGGDTGMSPYKHHHPATTTSASLTCTSTYHASVPKYRFIPPTGPTGSSSSSNNSKSSPMSEQYLKTPEPSRQPATEAARTALMGTQCNAAAGRIVRVASQRKRGKAPETMTPSSISTAEGSGPRARPTGACGGNCSKSNNAERPVLRLVLDGSGDIDDRTGKRGNPDVVRRIALRDPHAGRVDGRSNRKTHGSGHGIADVLVRLLVAYWNLVEPVFDAGSPVSRRFAIGKSTWQDCAVYALALVFVLGAFLAAVWAVKGLLLVVSLARTLVRGPGVLLGF